MRQDQMIEGNGREETKREIRVGKLRGKDRKQRKRKSEEEMTKKLRRDKEEEKKKLKKR